VKPLESDGRRQVIFTIVDEGLMVQQCQILSPGAVAPDEKDPIILTLMPWAFRAGKLQADK
jgi:hypothetical protein